MDYRAKKIIYNLQFKIINEQITAKIRKIYRINIE